MHKKILIAAALLAALCLQAATSARAGVFQTQAEQEDILKNVRVDEKPGAPLPRGLVLRDTDGGAVRLGDYLGKTPVVLTLNYYECPMLCPVTFANLARTLKEMQGLEPGRDYAVLTVSINAEERLGPARDKAETTWGMVAGMGEPKRWWPFLYGGEAEVTALTDAVGYRYVKLGTDNFAHPSVFIVITPEGRVARYLYGLDVRPMDLRLAITEAARGEVGASKVLNRIMLACYHYDPVSKRYALAATMLMKGAGLVVMLALGVMLIVLFRREKLKGRG